MPQVLIIDSQISDIDQPVDGGKHTDTSFTQINIYAARGVLIESQGPCWFYGTASEHNVLYQYQLRNAKDIFLGHMQTETPYMQPTPGALQPFTPSLALGDPTFPDCAEDDPGCEMAWALRVIRSRDVFIYSAGFYSFFSSYTQDCLDTETCQNGLIETSYSQGLWIYNLFTIGAVQAVTPRGGLSAAFQQDTQKGFSTEISAWLALAISGADLGGDGGPGDGSGIVYIDPTIWIEPSPTLGCFDPCTMVLPPSTLPSPVTIVIPPQTVTLTLDGGSVTTVSVTVATSKSRCAHLSDAASKLLTNAYFHVSHDDRYKFLACNHPGWEDVLDICRRSELPPAASHGREHDIPGATSAIPVHSVLRDPYCYHDQSFIRLHGGLALPGTTHHGCDIGHDYPDLYGDTDYRAEQALADSAAQHHLGRVGFEHDNDNAGADLDPDRRLRLVADPPSRANAIPAAASARPRTTAKSPLLQALWRFLYKLPPRQRQSDHTLQLWETAPDLPQQLWHAGPERRERLDRDMRHGDAHAV